MPTILVFISVMMGLPLELLVVFRILRWMEVSVGARLDQCQTLGITQGLHAGSLKLELFPIWVLFRKEHGAMAIILSRLREPSGRTLVKI